jgi:RNAse (barnase) inhibitor barstar
MHKNNFNLNLKPDVYLIQPDISTELVTLKCDELGCEFYHVDGKAITNEESFITHFGAVLNFPGGTGKNWDGFYDCLLDLMWEVPFRPKVVVYTDFSNFARNESYNFYIAFRHMTTACHDAYNYNYSPLRQLYIFLQGLEQDVPDEVLEEGLQEVVF